MKFIFLENKPWLMFVIMVALFWKWSVSKALLFWGGRIRNQETHSNWVFTNWFESIRTWVIEPRTILGWKNQERRNSFKLFTNWSLSKRTSKIIPALIIRPQIYTVVRWSSFTEAIVPFGCVWNRSSGTCKNIGAFPLFIVDAYPVGITNTYTYTEGFQSIEIHQKSLCSIWQHF